MFSEQTYLNRRDKLKKHVKNGIILLLGNIENPINFENNTYPFRQDSTFLYYFGVQAPNLAAIIDIDENREIIFGDELSIDDIVWTGQQEKLRKKAQRAGVTETQSFNKLAGYISKYQKMVHYLPPYQAVNKILLSELLNTPIQQLSSSVDLIKGVVAQRSIKEEQEIEEIEKAINVSTEMHLLAMRIARPEMKEYEITSAMQRYATDSDCSFAYPPIVTIHGEILHNHFQGYPLKSGDLILNDSGVETSMGYAADLTRTFPVEASFTPQQRDLYNIVLQSFVDARSLLRPGIKFKDIHMATGVSLVKGLKEVGLMRGDEEEAVREHAHTLFFQCGLGHMMGLDVHDMEDLGEQYVGYTEDEPKDTKTFGLKSLRLGKKLEEGFVLTVEPGIYIIPELIDMWSAEHKCDNFINYDELKKFRDFGGIRIEDNFLITKDSYRLLGSELIKSADDIEAYRQNNLHTNR